MGPSIICAGCGHENRETARFCEGCGDALVAPCGACGNELRPGASFCDACGVAVDASWEQTSAESSETRKVVTVVFADLVGSTALQEALDAESVRRVMTRFYDKMGAVVGAHGGSVEKLVGDAVVAAFGIPELHEDDAIRAVRAAAAMVSGLEDLNEDVERSWGVRLQLRAAVNTGELVVGPEGELVGDTMNTAARLEQAAADGEVLVGESTWRLVRHGLELEPVAPLKLKGKADPVRAWRLASIAAADRRRTPAVEVSLVGRTRELERLRAGFDAALTERQCRLVSVMGSPGVGKTRLANEFGTQLGDLANVVEGRCEPTGEGMTFLPIAEVLRTVAGIGEADPADIVREKLGALTPEDDPDRLRLTERLAGVLGVGEPASAEETFWALRRGLEALARTRPLVLVLDDLHWGQPMLLDLVEHLVEWVRDAPLLIVALARPELREVREALAFVGRRARDVIELEPLDEDESRELVSGLLGRARVPPALSTRILETTEGNPLFLGETVRMLVDEGLLQRKGEEWVAGAAVTTVEVPPTIQALLAARIERLRTDERSVVERAAVIGKQFYRGAVADLVAPPVRREIDGHLEALRRKDMVEPEGTYWIDEPVYRFHHALIRDAAYRSLLKEARAELHERFADWLEVKAGELVGEHEEVIAFHLEQAHEYRRQLGHLEEHGQALGARAAARLHSAGRRALAREDLAAAANLLGRALARDSGNESDILWDLAEALLSAGDTSTGAPVVERLGRAPGENQSGLARSAILRGQLANLTGAGPIPDTAESVAASATTLAKLGDEAAAAKGWQVAAGAYARLGQVASVEESLDRALAASRAAGDRRRTTAVLAGAPRAALWGPSPVVRASGRCLDVVRILRMTPGNRHVEAIALRCQAVLEAMRGRVEAAREILASGRATLEELGLALELHETAIHAGIVELLAGEPGAAVEHLRAAREGFEALGVVAGAAQAAALLARALVEQGGSDTDAHSQTLFAEEHGGEDLKTTITWCSARAEALARTGDVEAALGFARRAMSLAEPTDALADKADASMALARVLSAAGQDAEARKAALAARDWYEAKGHVVGVAWAERLVGEGDTGPAEAPAPMVPVVGERPPERWYAEYKRSFDAHDIDALVELYDESWMLVDHRAVGWEDLRGRDAGRNLNASLFASSRDAHAEIDEVLACDSRVAAVRMRYHGAGKRAGEWEFRVGQVTVIEDGRSVGMDQYEYDDDAAMLARYAELGGQPTAGLGDLVSERLNAEFVRRYNAHDLEGLLALYHQDFAMTDHRSIGWEGYQGLDALGQAFKSAFGISSDAAFRLDDVIACDDRVIALQGAWGGPAVDGGGDWELPVGLVTLNDGHRIVSSDLYEPDDIAGMIARYAELGGGLSALGDRLPERWWAELGRVFAARDLTRFRKLFAGDGVFVDHRNLGWKSGDLQKGAIANATAVWAMGPDVRLEVREVLACDDRRIALSLTWQGIASAETGGGEWAVSPGVVAVVEDGIAVRWEQYESEDRGAMLARYAELGGRRSVAMGDRPPERWYGEYLPRHASHDIEAALELYAEGFVMIDHRPLGWEEVRGRAQLGELYQSVFNASPGIRAEVDEVLACDERVIITRLSYRGHGKLAGEFEDPAGYVTVIEDGLAVSIDVYHYADDFTMLRRYHELGGRPPAIGDQPPEQLMVKVTRCLAAGDFDGLMELYADDVILTDHRSMPWENAQGREELRRAYSSGFETLPDLWMDVNEVLACDERVIAQRYTLRAHAIDGGGETALSIGSVNRLEDGQWKTIELYEPEDRQAMLARYAELAGRRTAVLGNRPPERYWAEFCRRWATRDEDSIVALYAEDYLAIEHRKVGWDELRGREAIREHVRSVLAVGPDLRCEIEEVLACDDTAIALTAAWRSSLAGVAGGWEVRFGYATVIEDGQMTRLDRFEAEDRGAILARYEELSAKPRGAASTRRPWERFDELYNARRLDELPALYTEDFVMIDRRQMAWEETRGAQALVDLARSTLAMGTDQRSNCVPLLDGGDVGLVRDTFTGQSFEAGPAGPWEIVMDEIFVLRDGLIARIELFDPGDGDASRRRYGELLAERRTALEPAPDVLVRDRRGFPTIDVRGADAYRSLTGDREPRVLVRDRALLLASIDDEPPLFVVAKLHEGQVAEAIVLRDELRAREWLHALTIARGFEEASVARDTEGLLAGTHPEGRIIDHRPLQFQDATTPDGIRDIYTGLGKLLARPHASVEVLDVHPGALAETVTWSAIDRVTGGAVEWKVFHAARMRDGLTEEIHSYADAEPALAKMEELSPAAGRARISRLFIEALRAHDWRALAELYAEDCVFVEHRALTDEAFDGVDGLISVFKAIEAMVTEHDVRGELIRDQSGDVFLRQVNTGNWNGGPWEVVVDSVAQARDGLVTRIELFDPDQLELRSARLAALAAQGHSDESGAGWQAQLADDLTLIDYREGGWGTLHGAAAVSARLGDNISGDKLASVDEAALVALPDGSFGVAVRGRDGELAHIDLYDDEQAAREKFAFVEARLVAWRVGITFFQALNRRDMGAARACLTDDLVVVEHRPVSGFPPELRTGNAYLELLSSLMELSEDIRWFYVDPGELTDGIGRTEILLTGHWNAGGGWAEIPVGIVFALREGRFEHMELYPPEARTEMKVRMAELVEDRRSGALG